MNNSLLNNKLHQSLSSHRNSFRLSVISLQNVTIGMYEFKYLYAWKANHLSNFTILSLIYLVISDFLTPTTIMFSKSWSVHLWGNIAFCQSFFLSFFFFSEKWIPLKKKCPLLYVLSPNLLWWPQCSLPRMEKVYKSGYWTTLMEFIINIIHSLLLVQMNMWRVCVCQRSPSLILPISSMNSNASFASPLYT